ncbi:hypothetical protein B9Z19DRAFT_455965 [Tuber borchii]|uniref:MARVEL domain-containing protein n=1 Tax=Tuber borchii TaxID=42251 RepID=A0A2T6ZFU7_TUBBO|nr:hypothetical protein B9Z19DRAFT_455965 [Tuber borchii]
MVQKNKSHRTPLPDTAKVTYSRLFIRIFQILISVGVAGTYGRDLHSNTQNHQSADSRWIFAEVVAGISIILAFVYMLPFVRSFRTFYLDGVVFLLWVILLGIFGVLFDGVDCGKGSSVNSKCRRMKAGVIEDAIGMVLWLFTFVGGGVMWWRDTHGRSIYTGRGSVA